ncbi:FUSC family protein [Hymenobacter sp. BRD128]|uniref:FUSC family membrane protein n=1 Tax=Hymenobacter sp. BRD128 TaxID=2675878 RepID=UPI001566058B|nr:FUSC family membrane protein [Hymenobacter sp. BRD128]QKG57702.1 FUSC family protein [Hymenobacter sp. BRD128]
MQLSVSRRDLSYFFFSQHFSDGLRTTLAILLPAVAGAQWGQFAAGITISTGAVCLSVTDTPGPLQHRRNGLLAALGLVFVGALLVGWLAPYRLALGVVLVGLSFGLTMLLVWGARAGSVGSAALLGMVLTLAHPPEGWQANLLHAGMLGLGGGWYLLLALVQSRVQPYRSAQQALGECLHAVAGFLHIKAAFYNSSTDLDEDYRRLVAQQVVVNEKQEAVRDLIFRSRQIVSESTSTGRRLVLTFTETVDLYEHITAGYYDYGALRAAFGETGILAEIQAFINRLATDLDYLGSAILVNRAYGSPPPDRLAELTQLQARINALPAPDPATGLSTLVLKKILVNLRDLHRRVRSIRRYFDEDQAALAPDPRRVASHTQFVARQELEWSAFGENLTLSSSVFRHAVRMAVACSVAFTVAELLWHGQHNYWILMTVTFMLKPGFSLTRERNIQRISGTLVGGVLGSLVLWAVPDGDVRFGLLLVFMVIAYSFQRTKYLVTVIFLTAYLLIMFSFLGLSYIGVIEERLTDTALGCAIALATAYLLFPRWEGEQLPDLLAATLRANLAYLRQLADRLAGREVLPTTYRLLRKDVYVASANLAAAFQRMLSEPRRTRRHPTEVHEFVVLNHILSANISALTTTWQDAATPNPAVPPEARRVLTSAQAALSKSLARLAAAPAPEVEAAAPATVALLQEVRADALADTASPDRTLAEQLAFLQKVSSDLSRVTEALVA